MQSRLLTALVVLLPLSAGAEEPGSVPDGLDYSKTHCSECHGIEANDEFSPLLGAPLFSEIANKPGMTERALHVWLQTSHPNMPNFIIAAERRDDLIAYIMSLKTSPAQ